MKKSDLEMPTIYTCDKCKWSTKHKPKFRNHLIRKTDCRTVEVSSAEFIQTELDLMAETLAMIELNSGELDKTTVRADNVAEFVKNVGAIVTLYNRLISRSIFVREEGLDSAEYEGEKVKQRNEFIRGCYKKVMVAKGVDEIAEKMREKYRGIIQEENRPGSRLLRPKVSESKSAPVVQPGLKYESPDDLSECSEECSDDDFAAL